MAQLSERQHVILEEIVRTYIRKAVPISSQHIAKKGFIPSSPASIRHIMMDLEEDGYLFQPHTSAGRIPTQKAYRFFVDNCIKQGDNSRSSFGYLLEKLETWDERTRMITKKAHVFAAVLDEDEITHFGTAGLFSEPEFIQNAEMIRAFGSIMDSLAAILEEYHEATRNALLPRVFIERENPVPETRRMSIVASPLNNERGVVIALGPSRMNYETVITILQNC